MIAGPSQCGKTTFTRQLLQQADSLFERSIRKIVYCYGQWQECFKDMATQVTFVEGIPEDIPSLFPPNCRPRVLVLDDLMRNCSDDERILDLFTKVSHHCDVTCIYLTQNLFPPGKFSRSISLNAHYIIAFNNPRDTLGFRTLAQQAFAGKFPRCNFTPVWLLGVGFTSSHTQYPSVTNKNTTYVTLLSCDLRKQESP